MRAARPRQGIARRRLLATSLAGGALSGALGAVDPALAAAAPAGSSVTANDVHRIAAIQYGTTLAAGDAEKIALTASGILASLHYLSLLKSDEVEFPFDYHALVEEAGRA